MNRLLAKSIIIIVAAVLMALCVGSAFAVYSVNATPITVNITASAPTPTTRTIYFTNNYYWGSVYAYVWTSSTGTPVEIWPGTAMTWVGKNDMNQDVYSITFPYSCNHIIFNDNDNNQTVNIDLTQIGSANAYYISGYVDGNYTVATWTR